MNTAVPTAQIMTISQPAKWIFGIFLFGVLILVLAFIPPVFPALIALGVVLVLPAAMYIGLAVLQEIYKLTR